MKIKVYTDGGSKGNPGPAAIGIVFYDEQRNVLLTDREDIGVATNNTAEYKAVIKAYKLLLETIVPMYGPSAVEFYADSLMVVQQLKGVYKNKQPHNKEYIAEIHAAEAELGL